MKKILFAFLACVLSLGSFAQEKNVVKSKFAEKPLHFGFESEINTFINSGWHGSVWVGKGGHRARLVVAKAKFPKSFTPSGFKDLQSTFFEIEIDNYFGKKRDEFRGFWFALGGGYTIQSIKSETTGLKGEIDLFDLHSGIGYAISLYKGLYINPWLGVDVHLNAPSKVAIGNEIWKPSKIEPVLGAKIGYSF